MKKIKMNKIETTINLIQKHKRLRQLVA